MWDKKKHTGQNFNNSAMGFDLKGVCCVSGDPDPGYNCDTYESDNPCQECGADLNVEECFGCGYRFNMDNNLEEEE